MTQWNMSDQLKDVVTTHMTQLTALLSAFLSGGYEFTIRNLQNIFAVERPSLSSPKFQKWPQASFTLLRKLCLTTNAPHGAKLQEVSLSFYNLS